MTLADVVFEERSNVVPSWDLQGYAKAVGFADGIEWAGTWLQALIGMGEAIRRRGAA